MTADREIGIGKRAEALRQAFDSSFAAPLEEQREETVGCIGFRVNEEAYAIRLSDIAGVHNGLAVTPCPSPVPELLGLAGIRGMLTAVYDLRALLGQETGLTPWVVLVRTEALGLAFDGFEGLLQLEPAAIVHIGVRSRPHISAVANHDGQDWSIIDVVSLLGAIHQKVSSIVARSA